MSEKGRGRGRGRGRGIEGAMPETYKLLIFTKDAAPVDNPSNILWDLVSQLEDAMVADLGLRGDRKEMCEGDLLESILKMVEAFLMTVTGSSWLKARGLDELAEAMRDGIPISRQDIDQWRVFFSHLDEGGMDNIPESIKPEVDVIFEAAKKIPPRRDGNA